MKKNRSKYVITEIIFIALMCALNVVFDILVSPVFIALFSHIVAGVLIMVPFNFLFMSITRMLVDKYGTLTLYLTIFGVLSIPTTLFGGVAGAYKILVGLSIGLLLDLAFLPKKKTIKIILGAIIGSICWWIATFSIWQLFQLPFVKAFSLMLSSSSPVYNGQIDLSGLVNLPIVGFGTDFFIFAALCGILSSIPVLIAVLSGYVIFRSIKKTAVYKKFQNMQDIQDN